MIAGYAGDLLPQGQGNGHAGVDAGPLGVHAELKKQVEMPPGFRWWSRRSVSDSAPPSR